MQEGRNGGVKPMPGYDPSVVLKEPDIGKIIARNRGAITKIAVLVIILIISFGILTSSGLSPISSIRDTDGDGVVDCFDKDWLNSSAWNQAYAQVSVSVANLDKDHNASFLFYFDGVYINGWTLYPMTSYVFTIPVSWYYGDYSTKTYTIAVKYSSSDPIDRNYPPIDLRTITVHPNDSIAMASYY
jgi:hypothetical protein